MLKSVHLCTAHWLQEPATEKQKLLRSENCNAGVNSFMSYLKMPYQIKEDYHIAL